VPEISSLDGKYVNVGAGKRWKGLLHHGVGFGHAAVETFAVLGEIGVRTSSCPPNSKRTYPIVRAIAVEGVAVAID
jgi:hypothetical protein